MIYPVKSVRRVKLGAAAVGSRGFEGDRRWLVIDPNGRFITQRKFPRMALITASIETSGLWFTAPDMPEISITTPTEHARQTLATVWSDECLSLDAGDEAAEWLSQFLGTQCRLVYMPEPTHRQIDTRYADHGDITSFADGFPFLLTTEASLDDLNSRLSQPVTMTHFRPNIVLSGAEAYEEDQWRRIKIGEVTFKVAKPCSRCVMTTVNPETGEKMGKDPLFTLSRVQKNRRWGYFRSKPDSGR